MAFSSDDYCFACGEKNPIGLHLKFEADGDKYFAKKIVAREYEGYENVVHGGILTTMLDEAMGNYVQEKYHEQALTAKLEIRYHVPTPIEQELTISAWEEARRLNIITMKAQIQTADGAVTAEATARFALVSLK